MAYGDEFVNNLVYVFYCDPPVQKNNNKKKRERKNPHRLLSFLKLQADQLQLSDQLNVSGVSYSLIIMQSFTRSSQHSYPTALNFVNSAMCRLPNNATKGNSHSHCLEIWFKQLHSPCSSYAGIVVLFVQHHQYSHQTSRLITTMVGNHKAQLHANTNGTWLCLGHQPFV